MRPSFNVLDEGWIPVITKTGNTEMLGIRKVLEQAANLQEISVASPLEEFSVYRFLSVFLMDALRPQRLSDIRRLLNRDAFDMDLIEAYITVCENEGVSFDLFDRERPFMQSLHNKDGDKREPVAAIDFTRASGDNHVHFDHHCKGDNSVSYDKAFRLLLTQPHFCASNGRGYTKGINGAPLPFFGIVKDENLYRTLVYMLQPVNTVENLDDPPVLWRTKEKITAKSVGNTSWLRGLFFPTRRIELIPDEKCGVTEVYRAPGENLVKNKGEINWRDPLVTYYYQTEKKEIKSLKPQKDYPIWRNFAELIDIKGKYTSKNLSQYVEVTDNEYTHLTLYGVESNLGSYLDIYRYDFQFPVSIAEDEYKIELLREYISKAEDAAKKLKGCLDKIPTIPKQTVSNAVQNYYSMCERDFWHVCSELNGDVSLELKEIFQKWCEVVNKYAVTVAENVMGSMRFRGKELAECEKQLIYLKNGLNRFAKEVTG